MPREKDSNQFRRGNLTLTEISEMSDNIAAAKSKLDGVIAAMKQSKIKVIHVDGIKKIPAGLAVILHGIENIAVGLTRAKGGV